MRLYKWPVNKMPTIGQVVSLINPVETVQERITVPAGTLAKITRLNAAYVRYHTTVAGRLTDRAAIAEVEINDQIHIIWVDYDNWE